MSSERMIVGFAVHFANLTDPRKDHTRWHELLDILVVAVSGTICGCDAWEDLPRYAKSKQEWLRKFIRLGNLTDRPAGSEYAMRIHGLLLPKALEDAVTTGMWMRSAPGPGLSGSSSWSPWNWCFYDFDQMERETEMVVGLGSRSYPGLAAFDSARVLCIADSGFDCPIGLIYQDSDVPGCVARFFCDWGGQDILAESFNQFAERLVTLPVVRDDDEAAEKFPRGTAYITEAGKRWRVGPPGDGVY